ncbi:MAG: hypothetical protein HY769_02375, partial [Candidatus Stahlbacteria bacterium]|nr:hypothetical protein [Candidatus Stahlbacteria bacterium]
VGEGSLVKIKFDVVAMTTDSTTFEFITLRFNLGNVPVVTQCGCLKTLLSYSISGGVKYFNNSAGVGDVRLNYISELGITDTIGEYNLRGLIPGNYIITPGKVNVAQEGAISSFDAVQILRHNVGLITLDSMQQKAADVSGNTQIEAYDAALVLRYRVGIIQHFPVGDWTFMPESKSYTPLDEDKLNEDYVGILYGDVNGSWSSKEMLVAKDKNTIDVFITDTCSENGTEILIPIQVSNLTNDSIVSADIELTYDSTILKGVTAQVTDITTGMMIVSNEISKGRFLISLAGTEPVEGGGNFVMVKFKVDSSAREGDSCVIELKKSDYNFDGAIVDVSLRHSLFRVKKAGVNENKLPLKTEMGLSSSNPFIGQCNIWYSIVSPAYVNLSIYNYVGQLVRELVSGDYGQGNYKIIWNGKDNFGKRVASGIYFCKLKVKDKCLINKIVYVK